MIKFYIFGFGHIGKLHATIANEYPGCSVVAVADSNPEVQSDSLYPKSAQYYKCVEAFLNAKVDCDVINL